jgi:C1A family cysteine protease
LDWRRRDLAPFIRRKSDKKSETKKIMTGLNPEELKKTLGKVGARWKASDEAKEYSLGYVPGPTEHSLATREMLAHGSYQQFLAMAAVAAPGYPASFDRRNHNGHNYITPIKDQGTCGSCIAFSCVATVEANVRVQKNEPSLNGLVLLPRRYLRRRLVCQCCINGI